jgi:hypothetical protein
MFIKKFLFGMLALLLTMGTTVTKLVDNTKNINGKSSIKSLVLTKAGTGTLANLDHASHGSHSSHASHYSHYSSS